MYRPLGHKKVTRNVFGGKALNRGLKIGAKSLGMIGDLALPAAFLAPAAVPVLEAAKAASVAMDVAQKVRQNIKNKRLI